MWKGNVVRSLFLSFEARTILNIPFCHSLPEDQIIWVRNRRGEFSVKSAYYIAYGLLIPWTKVNALPVTPEIL